MKKQKLLNLEEWFNLPLEEQGSYKYKLTIFSKDILDTCMLLRKCGAIISNETMIIYYKYLKKRTYGDS